MHRNTSIFMALITQSTSPTATVCFSDTSSFSTIPGMGLATYTHGVISTPIHTLHCRTFIPT